MSLAFEFYSLATYHLFPTNNTTLVSVTAFRTLTGKLKVISIFHYYRPDFYTFRTHTFFSNDARHYEVGFKVMIFSFIKF